MSPSPAAVALIRARVADWTPDNGAIADALNAPAVANPAPQPTVPKPFTVADLFGLVSQASLANIVAVPYLPDVRDKIQANDLAGCSLYVQLFAATDKITAGEVQAIGARVATTEPDPAWPAQIGWAQAAIGRPVDVFDIAASRPGA